MVELGLSPLALAIVAVGLAVAAADRKVNRRANLRRLGAHPGPVGDGALAGRVLAP